ncbi:MAG: hypothetical protein F6J86_11575 [Symploca sp. SIO1B1]|nr:hypothetical protein [Symploca sp. SIO1C2]NER52454.1 hypothetical protein [Symploca sp. SIO1A3]NER94461.1 hypothetical protein [Symploca sp. SIO1B1]
MQSQFPHLIQVYAGVKDSSKWLAVEEIAQVTGVNTHSIKRLVPMLHRLGVFDRAGASHSFYYKIADSSKGIKHRSALETAYSMLANSRVRNK